MTDGRELPWDGKAAGELKVRGPWICKGYYGIGTTQRTRCRGLVRDGRRRLDRPERLPADHRSREGRDQVGRRMDQLGRSRELRMRASRRADGRRDRRAAPEMGRAAVAARGAETGPHADARLRARAPRTSTSRSGSCRTTCSLVDAIPLTATGKINKLALRERYRDHLMQQPAG